MSESTDPTRQQSKLDDALLQINERFENLVMTISHLENRLGVVMNKNEQPVKDSSEDSSTKPTGDSDLVVKLYSHSSNLKKQTEHLQYLLDKLDI